MAISTRALRERTKDRILRGDGDTAEERGKFNKSLFTIA